MGLAAFVSVTYQAGLFEGRQMFRHRRLRDPGLGRERTDRLLALPAQSFEDGPPCRVGEGSEQDVMGGGRRNR